MSEQPPDNADAIGVPDITVVIPAFTEAGMIGGVVRDLRQAIPGICVLVVDDGSRDATAVEARSAGAQVIRHAHNKGYGASLKTGIRAARTPYIATYDADGQHRPEDLIAMLKLGGAMDMVIGARTKDSDRQLDRMPGKWILARVANLLTSRKIPDLNSGLRVVRRDVILRYLHLLPNGFSASTTMTICMLQRGYDVQFVAITTKQRAGGQSTDRKLRDGMKTIQLMIRLIILFNPGRFFLPPALLFVTVGLAYGLTEALIHRRGIPALAVMVVITGLIIGMFGLLASQISTLRIELFERERIGTEGKSDDVESL
jgi:glycosyltransferase involved in cell wall biosynthesis